MGFPGGSDTKQSACNAGDLGSIPGLEDPLEEAWQPTPLFLPRESHGQRSLAGYSPWGRKESNMSERLSTEHFISKFGQAVRVSSVFTSLIYLIKDVKRKLPIVMISNFGDMMEYEDL